MTPTPQQPLAQPAPAATGRPARRGLRAARQGGGTLLGIILGVAIGLAVAMAVAISVTKVPVPFVNKSSSRTNGQDEAEAKRNRDWDPNASLHSRQAAPRTQGARSGGNVAAARPQQPPAEASRTQQRPAAIPAPAEVRSPPATPAPQRDSATAARTPPAPAQRAPSSDDPLGDLVAARAGVNVAARSPAATAGAGSAGSANSGSDPFTYFVQAGAFRSDADADAQRARLSLMGVEARVSEREQAGRTVFRVRVGPFQNKEAADRVKERLASSGMDAALVRVQK